MEIHLVKDEPCEICGNAGFSEALLSCSRCKFSREHVYCRKTITDDLDTDDWLCEACEMGNIMSSESMKEDMPKTLMSKPSEKVDQICPAGGSKLPKWEKTVPKGKVMYLPAQEAIMLSSGAQRSIFPSKSNMYSCPRPSKTTPVKTPIKPKALPPRISSLIIKADPSIRPLGAVSPRHGNMHSVVEQQVIQTSKNYKGRNVAQSPLKKQPSCAPLLPPAESKSESTMEDKKENGASYAVSLATYLSPAITAGGGNDYAYVESRSSHAEYGDLIDVLPKAEIHFQGPARDSSWKGSFKIRDTISSKALNDGFRAHPPSKVLRKVYEFSKNMPEVLHFELLPRSSVWTGIFEDDCPDENDIGLYFFCSNNQRSENYVFLLESMETKQQVMRSCVDGLELFVFTSKVLSARSQRWNEEYFLWGLFRRVKKLKAVSKLYEYPPLLAPCAYSAPGNNDKEEDGGVDMEFDMLAGVEIGNPLVALCSDSALCHDAIEDDGGVDMEIDMLAGVEIGRTDVAVSREPSTKISLPLLVVKKEPLPDIPPGFEGIHRLTKKY